jgi:hypothetical protein
MSSIGKIKCHFYKVTMHIASYLHLFYIIEGVEIADFSSITQLFSHNLEFKKAPQNRSLILPHRSF